MRAILGIFGLPAVVAVVLMSLGMLSVNMQSGARSTVKLESGKAPEVKADVGEVGMGVTNKIIQVPTVEVKKASPTPATLSSHGIIRRASRPHGGAERDVA